MSPGHEAQDTVASVVRRLQAGPASPSTLRRANRVMRRAEPAARATCRAHARGRLSAAQVEEIVQDTLELVWKLLPGFQTEGPPFEAWVGGIAFNLTRNARRKKRRDTLTDDGIVDGTEPARSVLRDLQREERHELVTSVIQTELKGIEQDVCYLRWWDNLEQKRIAELLGLTENDVRAVLYRVRRRFRKALLARLESLGHSTSFIESRER